MNGRQLTEKQQRFVADYISNGAQARKAAISAGYGVPGAHTSAYRLLKLPHILEAIREEAEKRLSSNVALAAEMLVKLAQSAKSESVRLQAATSLLDRGGLPLIRQAETRHVIEDRRSDKELLEHIRGIASELGIPWNAQVIEGEVQAAEPETKPAAALPAPEDDIFG